MISYRTILFGTIAVLSAAAPAAADCAHALPLSSTVQTSATTQPSLATILEQGLFQIENTLLHFI